MKRLLIAFAAVCLVGFAVNTASADWCPYGGGYRGAYGPRVSTYYGNNRVPARGYYGYNRVYAPYRGYGYGRNYYGRRGYYGPGYYGGSGFSFRINF